MLPARHRLRSSASFAAVVRRHGGGLRSADQLMVVHLRPADEPGMAPPRVGFVVAKSVGGAVVRNRVKRRFRAQCAPLVSMLPPGFDLVVRALPASAQASSAMLGTALSRHLARVVRRAHMRSTVVPAARR